MWVVWTLASERLESPNLIWTYPLSLFGTTTQVCKQVLFLVEIASVSTLPSVRFLMGSPRREGERYPMIFPGYLSGSGRRGGKCPYRVRSLLKTQWHIQFAATASLILDSYLLRCRSRIQIMPQDSLRQWLYTRIIGIISTFPRAYLCTSLLNNRGYFKILLLPSEYCL